MWWHFDPMYFVFILPGLALSLVASLLTKSAFSKYSQIRTATGLTGALAAKRLLDGAGIHDVEVVGVPGSLTDHYDPSKKTLALSEDVYSSQSIAAVGVACHEAGHAIQHQQRYAPLGLRSALVPTVGLGSNLGYIMMSIGLFMMYGSHGRSGQMVVLAGAVLFSAVLLFQIVTLPVEFDASRRAKELAIAQGIVLPQERAGMDRVLNAAALTYVAAVISTLFTLLYYLFRAGLLGGRSRD
jgi:Zn-dependent membrane protease YugP